MIDIIKPVDSAYSAEIVLQTPPRKKWKSLD